MRFVKEYILCCFLFMVGCSSTKFDCKKKDGVSCRSLYEVNSMVNKGEIGKEGLKATGQVNHHVIEVVPMVQHKKDKYIGKGTRKPFRVPEETASIIIFPYASDDGVYHEETVLNIVLSDARWEG